MRFDKVKGWGVFLLGLALLAPAGVAQSMAREEDDRDNHARRDDDDQGRRNVRDNDDDQDDHHAGRDDDDYWRRGRDVDGYADDYGYQDGLRHGQIDRSRNVGYDYRSDEWKRGDRGYQRHMGSRGQYKKAYRNGYVRGYDAAYYGRGRGGWWGRNGGWGRGRNDDWGRGRNGGYSSSLFQVAQRNGYEDGVYYGQRDRRDGRSDRPTEAKGYRDADRGYSSSLGSKDEFKRAYRETFIRGYQQGYGSSYGWLR